MSNKQFLTDIYYTFGKNFLMASVVFFPRDLIHLYTDLDKDKLDLIKYVDRVFVFEQNGDNYFVDNEKVSIKILSKKVLLENNILHLLKLKEEFLPITFKYILKKYKAQLDSYTAIAKWLNNNAKHYVSELTNDNQGAFRLQDEIFQAHNLEFVETFNSNDVKMLHAISEKNNSNIELHLKSALDSSQIKEIIKSKSKNTKDKNRKNIKIKDLKELTKSYSEELILVKVFNVDISAIKTIPNGETKNS